MPRVAPKMSVLGKDKRLYAAQVRNRAEQAKLEIKLAQLEREKQRELKLMNIERQKFRSKYSKSSKETSEEKMYETHYPGFFYTRSGERRNSPKDDETTTVHFEVGTLARFEPTRPTNNFHPYHIRSLIFTEDEVDLEKIICLHLLCIHRSENLSPPKKKARCMCREHSPCERLIERSKRGFNNYERLSKMLPLYTIELIERSSARGERLIHCHINDIRLASRILINEKVMALINTVVTALEKTNTDKFRQLLMMGNNPEEMRRILGTARMSEFADFLLNHQLLNSCDSYILTPPFKIRVQDLDIRTSQGSLEHFVNNLRQNVLQQAVKPVAMLSKEEEADKDRDLPKTTMIMMPKPKMEQSKSSEVSVGSSRMSTKVEMKKNRRSLEDRMVGRHVKTNFVARNKEDASKTKRIEYDVEEDDWDFIPCKRSSTSSGKVRMKIIEPIVKNITPLVEERESEEEKFISSVESNKSNENESDAAKSAETPKRRHVWERHETKNHIRQTTCPACMERWKQPLPTPKTPRVKESDVLPDTYTNSLRTNSHHRISMMINKAMYSLESYDRRYSPENEHAMRIMPKQEVEYDPAVNVYLNPMDLAKIEQEIKERETKKKLEKFLGQRSNKKK